MSRAWLRSTRRRRRDAALERLAADDDPTVAAVGRALAGAVAEPGAEERRWIERIEGLRAALGRSPDVVPAARGRRRGEGSAPGVDAAVSRLALEVSKPARWGRVLLSLTRELRPARSLELGTCIGLSTAYQAAGLEIAGEGEVTTIELRGPRVELSRVNLERLGLAHRVDARAGRFEDALDEVLEGAGDAVGFAFVDGHHKRGPTLDYFKRVAARIGPAGGVVLLDDIGWSRGMQRAWEEIAQGPDVALAADLDGLGLCVVPGAEGRSADVPHRLDLVLHP